MMNANLQRQKSPIGIHGIAQLIVPIGVAGIMIVALASCASPSSGTPSQPAPAATQTTPSSSAQPAASSGAARSRPGANGTVTQVSGSTITLNTQSGQVTIDVLPNAMIQDMVAGTAADLQSGEIVTVVGSPDANGNIVASRISIRPQSQGFPSFTPPPGASPGPGGPSGTPGGGFNPGGPNRASNMVFGTIASVNGNELTVSTAQSQQTTVTISSATTIEKTVTGSLSDVQVGQTLSAVGTPDQSGNIQARLVTIGSGNVPSTP